MIIRIDVDRPYGRRPVLRHILSRVSSDLYFPRVPRFGFLTELETMLGWLNTQGARSYVFFRRCTLPSEPVLKLLRDGRHEIGLHLENSRSLQAFREELALLKHHTGNDVLAFSKHGSGGARYGLRHYAPYEPDRYIRWAQQCSMRLFLGNLQDPSIPPQTHAADFTVYPSAFWLEPHWRDCSRFTVKWLLENAPRKDIVLLVHPENVLGHSGLLDDFKTLVTTVGSRIVQ